MPVRYIRIQSDKHPAAQWTVFNVPHGLEHFATWEDGMGLSDLMFPMFLFAMGMSIPYAIDRRFEKGIPFADTLRHVLERTLALILMGAFIRGRRFRGLDQDSGRVRCSRRLQPSGL